MPPTWLHPPMERDKVEEILKNAGGGQGTFLVRKRPTKGEYVLSVMYKGKPTHHLCKADDEGIILINNKDYAKTTSISALITKLSKEPLPPGWPVALSLGCNVDGSASPPKASSGSTRRGSTAGAGGARRASTARRGSTAGGSQRKAWLHVNPSSKEDAGNLLKSAASDTEGAFFVRPRGSEYPNDYVMAVIYKGRDTHHLIVKDGAEFKINNKPTGAATLTSLVSKLRSKQPYWPVPLVAYVKKDGTLTKLGARDSVSQGRPRSDSNRSTKSTKSTKSTAASSDWLHPPMSKGDAEEIIKEDGLEEGKFFVRKRGADTPNDYVICVVYRNRPTHHLTVKKDNQFYVNNKPCGGVSEIGDVVEYLRQKRPFWPIPLGKHVSSGAGVSETPTTNTKAEEKEEKVETKKEEEDTPPEPEEPKVEETPEEKERKEKERIEKERKMAEKKAEEDRIKAEAKKKEEEARAERERRQDRLNDPNKLWIDGKKLEVKIVRQDMERGFGFGLASKFRVEGRAKVISFVDPKGPAYGILEKGDELLAIYGESTFELELEDVKLLIRDMDVAFEGMVFRARQNTRKQDDPPELPRVTAPAKGWKTPKRALINPSQIITRKGKTTKCAGTVYCPCLNCRQTDFKLKSKTNKKIARKNSASIVIQDEAAVSHV